VNTNVTAFITPQLVRWARERVGHSVDKVAEGIGTDPEQIARWEQGDAHPTFRDAQRLARALSIPFGYLYLSSPPKENILLPDFRTLPSASAAEPSAEFLDLLNDVLLKQQWYREYLQEEGGRALTFVGRFTTRDGIDQVANDIRMRLRIDEDLRRGCASRDEFMVEFVKRVEGSGILVMRSRTVGNSHRALSVSEFRGFAISDEIAPLVFINAQDAKAAQIFTLAHELVHIWIGKTGISNPSLQDPMSDTSQLERFCNQVSAEVLIPASDVNEQWTETRSTTDNIRALSNHYKVSTLVVLRRAYDQGKITSSEYNKLYRRENDRFIARNSEEQSGGDFHATLRARNSATLTAAIVTAALERRIPLLEAAKLLHVKVSTIQRIADRIAAEGNR
jgi:Zn-dependent peptidase ImmA (M78 family)/DNA-binding XRE family transcriptional regulator